MQYVSLIIYSIFCILIKSIFENFTDGYAPFLSMTSRETFLNISDQVVAAPGPGHYDPAFAQDNIKVRFSATQNLYVSRLKKVERGRTGKIHSSTCCDK